MNGWSIVELLNKYGKCPDCGNEYINNGHGGLVIEDNTFRRFCKCGFDITLDEDGKEIKKNEVEMSADGLTVKDKDGNVTMYIDKNGRGIFGDIIIG